MPSRHQRKDWSSFNFASKTRSASSVCVAAKEVIRYLHVRGGTRPRLTSPTKFGLLASQTAVVAALSDRAAFKNALSNCFELIFLSCNSAAWAATAKSGNLDCDHC